MVGGTTESNGRTVMVARLYDTASGTPLGEPLPVGALPSDAASGAEYFNAAGQFVSSPDGKRFITSTAGPGQSEILWDVDLADWEAMACRIAGRNLTMAEWNQYLPGQAYRVTCPQWPAGT
jgi:hypothetical protein